MTVSKASRKGIIMKLPIRPEDGPMIQVYKNCRLAGMAAGPALERARYVRKISEAFEEWDVDYNDTGTLLSKVDVNEDGTEIGEWKVQFADDDDSSFDDADCYTPDAKSQFGDSWKFYGAVVEYEARDGRTGETSIWSIDAGDHWQTLDYPLHTDLQIFASAVDYYELHEEAKRIALDQAIPMKAHVDRIAASIPNVVPGRDVFYNQDGDEALIAVQRTGDTTIFISVDAGGNAKSSDRFVGWDDGVNPD